MHVSPEIKDGQAKARQRHELTDLPPMALLQRITALDRTQELLQQRVVTLEANVDSVGQKPHTTITPWRVLNSALILGLGGYKAITTYQGQSIGPTTTDWIVGVVWTLMYVHSSHTRPNTHVREVHTGSPSSKIQLLAIHVGSFHVICLESCSLYLWTLQSWDSSRVSPASRRDLAKFYMHI